MYGQIRGRAESCAEKLDGKSLEAASVFKGREDKTVCLRVKELDLWPPSVSARGQGARWGENLPK